jgi:hypothetical protein
VQPLLQCESNNYYVFWVCACNFSYPRCRAHAPCFIVVCGLPGSIMFFHIISYTARFLEEKLLNIKCMFRLCEKFFIARRIQRDLVINVHWSSCKVPLFLSDFSKSFIFSTDFVKKSSKYKILWKSVLWGPSCSMRTDKRRDMAKLIVDFRNFANVPKNWQYVGNGRTTGINRFYVNIKIHQSYVILQGKTIMCGPWAGYLVSMRLAMVNCWTTLLFRMRVR